ncbi:MAG: helicase, partial [Verrucomicrobiota bacterium]
AEDPGRRAAREAELDDQAQQRQTRLRAEIQTLTHRIQDARRWIGLDESAFRDALDCSLQCLDVAPLQPLPGPSGEPTRFAFPNLQTRKGGDPRWAATLDTLRPPQAPDQTLLEWRQAAPLRPVIFAPPSGIDDDTVQLHLSHRVAQRLLGRFLAQGFYHDLSRACLAQSDDSIPRVVLLGRLALYGAGAARLHEQLLTVTARWMEPTTRKAPLSPYGRDAETRTMNLLQESLRPGRQGPAVPEAARQKLQASMAQDIRELLPHLEERGLAARSEAEKVLSLRGQAESESITQLLLDQQRRVLTRYQAAETDQLLLGFSEEEKRQLAADRRHWERWLANVEGDLTREPARIAAFYQTRSYRLEP